jgi:hypothetical protein
MAQNKTKFTAIHPYEYLQGLELTSHQLSDCHLLIQMMEKITASKARMFGTSIIGCGSYAYRYKSGHSGEAPLLAFSPRKHRIVLYIAVGRTEEDPWIEAIGNVKRGKSCIYVNSLLKIDRNALQTLMIETVNYVRSTYPNPHNSLV